MELKLVFTNLVKDVPFYRKLDLYFQIYIQLKAGKDEDGTDHI